MKFTFPNSARLILILSCLGSGLTASASETYNGSVKYGMKVTSSEVYKYIADFGEFNPQFWNVIFDEYDEYPMDTKKHLKSINQRFRSALEEQLMGDDEKETRQALQFYEDTYRLTQLYREIHSRTNTDLLFDLMQIWEKGFRDHIKGPEQAPYQGAPLLAETAETLKSAGVADPTFSDVLGRFETIAKLYADISNNSVMVLLRKAQKDLVASPDSVQNLGMEIQQAVRWSFVSREDPSGGPSTESFRAAIKRF